jgi:molybdenum cofactor cytidylyltransferase
LFARGHILTEDDACLIETEGLSQVSVTDIEDGEVSEDDAVSIAAREVGCGRLEIRLAPGGRANLFTTEDCCVLVDTALLNQINSGASIVIATIPNFSFAPAGTWIATVKGAPFAVPQSHLETVVNILKERGPILQARAVREPSVAILYTDPLNGDRARRLFESILRQRLQRFGTAASFVLASMEEEDPVAQSLQHLLRAKPTVILVASTTAPAGPEDVIGRGMTRIGCHLERFLAPVEPGNLFMLGYKDEIPIVSAPGCFRSVKLNIIDLILPPMLARYHVSAWEVAGLGHGGLLG